MNNKETQSWYQNELFRVVRDILIVVVGLLALVPVGYEIFNHRSVAESRNWVVIVCGTLAFTLAMLLLFVLREFGKKATELESSRTEARTVRERLEVEASAAREVLQAEKQAIGALRDARDQKEMFIAQTFRDMAVFRSGHSATYLLFQKVIDQLASDRLFGQALRMHAYALSECCDFASRLFSAVEGCACYANIKILLPLEFARNWGRGLDPRLWEYGADVLQVDPRYVVSKPLARCHGSRNNYGRKLEDVEPRLIGDNRIFHGIYTQRDPHYATEDIERDLKLWEEDERGRHLPRQFKYPDADTLRFYRSLLVAPIKVAGSVLPADDSIGFAGDSEEAILLGFLSIDSRERVDFRKSLDINLAYEIATNLASISYEYFRCVRHLQYRLSQ